MKTKHVIFLFFAAIFSLALTNEAIKSISEAIAQGDAKGISKHFVERIDLKVLEKEDVYSKQQAEMILKTFFAKHPAKEFKIAHKSEPKNGSQYFIGTLLTGNGTFRVNFLSKTVKEQTLIQQFTIEKSNE